MLERLTCDDWQVLVGSVFKVALGARQEPVQDWVLDAVRVWGEAQDGRRAPYTLTFGGPLQPYAGQGMHRLEHPALGTLEIFLVPIGPARGRMCYEAVFS